MVVACAAQPLAVPAHDHNLDSNITAKNSDSSDTTRRSSGISAVYCTTLETVDSDYILSSVALL